MPVLIGRREGTGLSSTFVSVLEPFAERPFLQSVERLPWRRPARRRGTEDRLGGRRRLPAERTRPAGSLLRSGDLVMQGRLGFVRERGGAIERMTLVGGHASKRDRGGSSGAGVIRGEISGALRRRGERPSMGSWWTDPFPTRTLIRGLTVVVSDRGVYPCP